MRIKWIHISKALSIQCLARSKCYEFAFVFWIPRKRSVIIRDKESGDWDWVWEKSVCHSYSSSPSGFRGTVPIHLHIPVPSPVPRSQRVLLKGLLDAGFPPMASSSTPIQSWSITSHMETGFSEGQTGHGTSIGRHYLLPSPDMPCPALSGWPGPLVQTGMKITLTYWACLFSLSLQRTELESIIIKA